LGGAWTGHVPPAVLAPRRDALAAKYPTYARLAELAARLNGLFRTDSGMAGLTATIDLSALLIPLPGERLRISAEGDAWRWEIFPDDSACRVGTGTTKPAAAAAAALLQHAASQLAAVTASKLREAAPSS
jgi:hypothetical protein